MDISFDTEATREQARARVGLQGPAGCGKTKSALRIAEGLAEGGTIGLVDTERRSSLTYAVVPGKPHLGGHVFRPIHMDSYDPRNLIQAVEAAERARLAVLIVDSWSHFWNGRGGLLEIVDQAGGGAGSFGGWKKGNPIEQDMLSALLNFSGHLIVTMRTKTDYVIDDSGPKKKITKVGTKVIQREGTDYELGVIIDMIEGTGTVTKTRYEPLEGLTIHHPGEELGAMILEQLGQGADPVTGFVEQLMTDGLTYESALELYSRVSARHLLAAFTDHPQTGKPVALGELIKEYGSRLKPAPTSAPDAGSVPPQQPTDAELYAALESGHPDVEAEAGQQLAERGQLPVPPSAVAASEPAMATAPQMRMMHALLKQAGLTERSEVLEYVTGVIGRPIESRNELTFAEITHLINHLQNAPALASA